MIDVHTLYVAALISQGTFALTLCLLAWSDRRTKGTRWLAAACALQFAWTTSRALSKNDVRRSSSEGLSACLLILLMYCVYVGFRWFVKQHGVKSRKELFAASGAMALVLAASLVNERLAVVLGRCIGLGIGVKVITMLWTQPVPALKTVARWCGVLLAMTMLIIVVNMVDKLPMEAWLGTGQEESLVVVMRAVTIALLTLLSFSFIVLFVKETNRRLLVETRTDSLTGLSNRRAMEEEATRLIGLAVQNKTPLAILMVDLDLFKDLNDTFGHAVGDRALRAVGSVLKNTTSTRDMASRMGGEEFSVLLPGRDMDGAAHVAEELRATIATLRLHEAESSATVTASIGVSVLREGERGWIEMLCRADDALYRAKREGRNRVEICAIGESPMTPERAAGQRAWRKRWSVPKQML
jgi:diguanylate cyclase (GGDEF)-like protein